MLKLKWAVDLFKLYQQYLFIITFGGNEAILSTIPLVSLSNCSSGKTLVTKPLEYASDAVILCPKSSTSFAYGKIM